jgi:hypothetical protein
MIQLMAVTADINSAVRDFVLSWLTPVEYIAVFPRR